MAATASWQPQEEGFREICGLLEQQISPTSDKSQIWQQLQHYSQYPDFNNYLVFILARAEVRYPPLLILLRFLEKISDWIDFLIGCQLCLNPTSVGFFLLDSLRLVFIG
ncbi:hypothetical protein CsSME_00009121 [Camellia sinensis var. sinensis]